LATSSADADPSFPAELRKIYYLEEALGGVLARFPSLPPPKKDPSATLFQRLRRTSGHFFIPPIKKEIRYLEEALGGFLAWFPPQFYVKTAKG
jgi:hypothetical protein